MLKALSPLEGGGAQPEMEERASKPWMEKRAKK